jgi:signal transduction histidine kinase
MSESRLEAGEGLAAITRVLASSGSREDIAALIAGEVGRLGFATMWMGAVDDPQGGLATLHEVHDGRVVARPASHVRLVDRSDRFWIGDRNVMNVREPATAPVMHPLPPDEPDWRFGLPQDVHRRLCGTPFAYHPLLGSRGEPIGALGLAGYQGGQPIPDRMFEDGPLPVLIAQLTIAIERAFHFKRIDWLENELDAMRATLMREPLTRAVGELTAAAAHALNNLSGTALLALSSIGRSEDDISYLASRAERATRSIGDLSRRLQRMARAGAPSQGSQASADLKEIVEDVATLIRPLCKERSIQLDFDLVDLGDAAVVQGDETMIRQAVMTVILNARDAVMEAAPERRTVEIRIGRRANEIELVVRDHGPGISPAVAGQLFRPFVSTKSGHAGVGLATAHASITSVGGRLEASNEPDGGASFRFTFRLARIPRPVVGASATESVASLRVLVVDDEPEFITGVRDVLRSKGHSVTSATDASEAFESAGRDGFDLVLMDHGMPKRSGLDVLRALRGSGTASKLVLMTGWDSDIVRTDPRARHCDRILQKPFAPNDIEQLVNELFVSP